MEGKRIKSSLTWQLEKKHMEHPTGPSKTVPDEAYTIEEIFRKHASGINLGVTRQGTYDSHADHDSDDIEKLAHLDPFDRELKQRSLAEDMLKFETEIENDKKAKAERLAAEKAEYEEIKTELRRRKNQPGGDQEKGKQAPKEV